MWSSYFLLFIFIEVQAGQLPNVFNQGSQINITGTGTIDKNGKTLLKILFEIRGPLGHKGSPGAGTGGPGAGTGGPGAGTEGPGLEAGGPGAGGATFTEEEQIGLEAHNKFRQVHQVPLMTLDREMCDQAKLYAEQLATMGTLQHSSREARPGQGENLSYGCSTSKAQAMEEAVNNWYKEVCDPGYDFTGGMNTGTGHFTQVVWKESTLLGIGRAVATTGRMKCAYIVGRYKPAGNFLGKFRENVLKGSFDAGSYCSGVSKRRKLFEQHENAMVIDAPISADDAWNITGSAEFRGQHTELSNSKKKSTVNHKTN